MADPLSIVGSVVGVASLGIQVTQSLIDFYNAYRDKNSDLANILRNLQELADNLRHLKTIWEGRTLTENDQCLIERIHGSITNCSDAIHELKETCQKFIRATQSGWKESLNTIRHQAAYPFKKSTLQKLIIDIGEIRDNLSFLLEIVQLKATTKFQDDLDEIKALLELINGKQVSSSLREWLRAPDPTVDHNSACAKKTPGSGTWLLESSQFSSWSAQASSLLWLNGFAGSGKSVLCSTAIQLAFRDRRGDRNIGIAFFYFTFNDKSKQDESSMLRALLWQLSSQVSDGPTDLLQLHEGHNMGMPPSEVLLAYLRRLMGRFQRTYIFLDALDECPRMEGREGVLDILEEIGKWDGPNVNLFVTSRDEPDIRQSLGHLAPYQIEMRNTGIDNDIANFISRRLLEDRQLLRLSNYHDRIRTVLTEGAKGVFRWVECQLKSLRFCPKSEDYIQRKLKSLPASLDATYEQIFCSIDSDLRDDARRILTFLCFAYRPLTIRELIDAIAVNISEPIGLNYNRRLEDVDDIRDICAGFVDIDSIKDPMQETDSSSNKTEGVRIAHFSVQEYLMSSRILESKAGFFSINGPFAHVEIAQICLTYLLEEGLRIPDLDRNLIERFPLSHFAAMYWHRHYRDSAACSIKADALILNLFQSRQSFVSWVKLHDVDQDLDKNIYFDRRPDAIATPLYYASLLGLQKTLSSLISEQPAQAVFEQVNKQGGQRGNALQAASYRGSQDIVQLLLDKGADINTQGGVHGNALQTASLRGYQHIVQLLLDKGADISAQGGVYGNALQAASCSGIQDIVQLLLDKGADISAQGGVFGNALQAASRKGYQDIVRLLLDKGADINARGGHYNNALQAASCGGSQDIIQLLLDKGADINAQGGTYGNALQAASANGYQDIVRLLLDKGADINAQSGDYSIALQAAPLRWRQFMMAFALNENDDDINMQGGYYGNALQAASSRGHQDTVRLLLDKGADINAQGGLYGNALQAASSRDHHDIVKLLLDRGARWTD